MQKTTRKQKKVERIWDILCSKFNTIFAIYYNGIFVLVRAMFFIVFIVGWDAQEKN